MLYSRQTINELVKITCQHVIINKYKVTDINNVLVGKLVSSAIDECSKLECSNENRMVGVENKTIEKLFSRLINALLLLQNRQSDRYKIYVGEIYRESHNFINKFKEMK